MSNVADLNQSIKYFAVEEVKSIGEGTRVCLDFVDILEPTEGVFVGNTGFGYVEVLSENRSTNTYPPRPFRVNIGALHQYLYLSEDSVSYLSDVVAGSCVSVFLQESIREVPVGRVKLEKRELCRVVCRDGDLSISATLQFADSVHLYCKDKGAVSIIDIKPGDKVRCLIDKPGRHLGRRIEEEISEK